MSSYKSNAKRYIYIYINIIAQILLSIYVFFTGNGIILGPKIISVNSDAITSPIPVTSTVKRSTFSSTEVPIMPKKKLSLASSKNPIIFPKVDCNTNLSIPNATLIKTVPTLKIMSVGQLLTEKEETKPIFIMQNPIKKIENSTRQIIQINPNYEIDQNASKNNETWMW